MRMNLAPLGPSLISRTRGAAIRETILADVGQDREVVLDFESVERASYSFIDELVGSLNTMHREGQLDAEIVVENANGAVSSHVAECLARRLAERPHATA
jgi:anti-anti-sigma regulatory factor